MPTSLTSRAIRDRMVREGKRPADATLLGSAAIRGAIGWVLALAVVLVAVQLPWHGKGRLQGWSVSGFHDRIELQASPREIVENETMRGGLITSFDEAEPEDTEDALEDEDPGAEEETDMPEPRSRTTDLRRMDQQPILEFVDQLPAIEGGIGALYLQIHYPEAALRDNVQGRSIIEFVVEEDGTTSNISVLQPLHPACDSVAVQAIRGTRFVPGRQNGELVRVKMRLPIRFRLLSRGQPIPADSSVNAG